MKTIENLSKIEKETGKREDVFCNKCGMSCRGFMGKDNGLIEQKVYFNGIEKIKVSGGYDSTHIDDGDMYVFSLCEKCLIKLINSLKLYAYYGNYMFPQPSERIWNDLSEENQWKHSVTVNDEDLIDWFKNCSKEFLQKRLDYMKTVDPGELCRKDYDVAKLIEKFLGGMKNE